MGRVSNSACPDLLRLLAALAEPPTERHADFSAALGLAGPAALEDWRIAHTAAFIEQCPPYVSTLVGEGGRIGGEAADRVADFRRLLGSDVGETPDDLAALLADYAELVERAGADVRAGHARAAMLWEHLLSWAMPYLDGVARSAPPPYDRWALLTRDVLALEADVLAVPEQLPLHLRAAPPVADLFEAESADSAIRSLLTPIVSGIVLTRADLARAVAALEAGLVQNSRSFIVKHLFEQDGPAMLAWLARQAREQAQARVSEQARLGDTAMFWATRATTTADALATLAGQIGDQRSGDDPPILRSA